MPQDKPSDRDQVPSADQLRSSLEAERLKKALADSQIHEARERELHEFTETFLRKGVTEEEIARVRGAVNNAVREGKYEAMVYRFPSALCTDKGRAINNGDKDWPTTLQGKAKEFYDRYESLGRPQGYKLKAMIVDFPGGMPGDVGLFLNWEDERF